MTEWEDHSSGQRPIYKREEILMHFGFEDVNQRQLKVKKKALEP